MVRLWHKGWHEAHAHLVPEGVLQHRSREDFLQWLKRSSDVYWVGAGVDTGIRGFVATNGDELVKLYVAANAQGSGIAQALLSHGERAIQEAGFLSAKLFCTAGNLRAEKFYARAGWVLSRTFEDQLWTPQEIHQRFILKTHAYCKNWKM